MVQISNILCCFVMEIDTVHLGRLSAASSLSILQRTAGVPHQCQGCDVCDSFHSLSLPYSLFSDVLCIA